MVLWPNVSRAQLGLNIDAPLMHLSHKPHHTLPVRAFVRAKRPEYWIMRDVLSTQAKWESSLTYIASYSWRCKRMLLNIPSIHWWMVLSENFEKPQIQWLLICSASDFTGHFGYPPILDKPKWLECSLSNANLSSDTIGIAADRETLAARSLPEDVVSAQKPPDKAQR